MDKVELVHFRKGKRIYSLEDSFNVLISGRVRDENSCREFGVFDILADYPMQVNVFEKEKPFSILTPKEKDRVLQTQM